MTPTRTRTVFCDLHGQDADLCPCARSHRAAKPTITPRPIAAWFSSRCPECQETIHEGQTIMRSRRPNGDGAFVHEECVT